MLRSTYMLGLLLLGFIPTADAATVTAAPSLDYHATRRSAARAEFMKSNPCPANGNTRGACPGYIVDNVVPLCAGGADHMSNMQWQTKADGLVKDAEERKMCRKLNY